MSMSVLMDNGGAIDESKAMERNVEVAMLFKGRNERFDLRASPTDEPVLLPNLNPTLI